LAIIFIMMDPQDDHAKFPAGLFSARHASAGFHAFFRQEKPEKKLAKKILHFLPKKILFFRSSENLFPSLLTIGAKYYTILTV